MKLARISEPDNTRRMGRPARELAPTNFHGRVGAEIRKRRERAKLTVQAAAAAAGASEPAWYHWEAGRHLNLARLPAIAAALGCKVRQLIPDE